MEFNLAQRVSISKAGGPEVLRVETYDPPLPQAGEVLLRNQAVGVAFADVAMREGVYPGHKPPLVPGYEVVGRISALGPGVDGWKAGDYVAALTVTGGYATDVVIPAADLVPVPRNLAPESAAALVLNGLTAYQLLVRCCPAGLSSIAVFGAAGGVGSILLDLARHQGLTTYGFGSREKHQAIAAKGAIPLTRTDPLASLRALAPDGVDAVFDGVGGRNAKRSFSMLNEGGMLVLFGVQSMMNHGRKDLLRAIPEFAGMPRWSSLSIFGSNRGIVGYFASRWKQAHPDRYRNDLSMVFQLAAQGILEPLLGQIFDLTDAQSAHRSMNQASHTGKIVLRITG